VQVSLQPALARGKNRREKYCIKINILCRCYQMIKIQGYIDIKLMSELIYTPYKK
jgi:hypothetical protein